jgi:hypothetical protein
MFTIPYACLLQTFALPSRLPQEGLGHDSFSTAAFSCDAVDLSRTDIEADSTHRVHRPESRGHPHLEVAYAKKLIHVSAPAIDRRRCSRENTSLPALSVPRR